MQVLIQNPANLYGYDKNRLAGKEPDEQNAEGNAPIFSDQKTKLLDRETKSGFCRLAEGVRHGRIEFLMAELAKKAAAIKTAAGIYFFFAKEPTSSVAHPNMGSA